MHIEMDGKIRYCRKLEDGQGSRVYGLEVCNALGLPSEFLTVANRVRRHVMGVSDDVVKPKPSRYNRNVIVDVCKVCGQNATETHHIRYQKDAIDGKVNVSSDDDSVSTSGSVGLHQVSNLVPLCEECHQKEHTGEIQIKGYVQTTDGVELVVQSAAKPCVQINDESYSTLYEKLRYGPKGWKHKTKTGKWIGLSAERAVQKLGTDDVERAKKLLYDGKI
jgi:ribosomal protein L44E